jgi:hypothetical protein
MANITDLPPEVIVQIMREYRYARHILRLTATCKRIQQVWRDNASTIASTVFSFPRSELFEIVALAHLEASPPNSQLQAIPEQDLNTYVSKHIRFLGEIYYGARVLVRIANGLGLDFPICTTIWRSRDPEPLKLRYCTRLFLLLRRFAIGYNHPASLPVAYAQLQAVNTSEMNFHRTVTRKFEGRWTFYGKDVGVVVVEKPIITAENHGSGSSDLQQSAGDEQMQMQMQIAAQRSRARLPPRKIIPPLPLPWAFAVQIFKYDHRWRPPRDMGYGDGEKKLWDEDVVRSDWEGLCERFGWERIEGVFGDGEELPWAEERVGRKRR